VNAKEKRGREEQRNRGKEEKSKEKREKRKSGKETRRLSEIAQKNQNRKETKMR
jgi:hypothetical protein